MSKKLLIFAMTNAVAALAMELPKINAAYDLLNSKGLKVRDSVRLSPDSSAVSGYLTRTSFYGTATCNSGDYVQIYGYQSNSCFYTSDYDDDYFTSGGNYQSFMITLASSDSCSGGFITFYTDDSCEAEAFSEALSNGCNNAVLVACHSSVYVPADSWLTSLYTTNGCSGDPIYYDGFVLNTCVGGSEFLCSDTTVTAQQYDSFTCNNPTTSFVLSTLVGTCTSSFGSYEVTCTNSNSNTDSSTSSSQKSSGLNRLEWVFVVIGIIVVFFAIGMGVRWWVRRNRPPKPSTGEVKMVTLFSSSSSAAVKYAAAESVELRV